MLETVLLFREALYGALVIALACSVLGVYVVLRRIVFVGAAIAQLSSAGIALALFLAGLGISGGLTAHPTAFALAFGLAGAMFFGVGGGQRSGVPPDATIGVAYAVAASAGILLIAKASTGEAHDIFLSGNILGITRHDTLILLAVTIPVLLVHLVFYKEFLFVSFDRETARTLGYRVTFWNLLLYFTLGLVIAFAMQFAGVMLVFNFLVLPAVTGLLLARSMRGIFVIAIASALVAAVVGFSVSVPFDLPSGPAIIAASGGLALLAYGGRVAQRR
ncbi:MAG: metal ABC transporter permease [Gemmatimonadaceae bacterium]|nr:metal ABC transporter permease [Geodermatophilaceae bacterium]MBA3671160.1 metal ABC transporter permease [Gemmatimonadaceae bacterium]